jgi:hypothetical protein
MAPSGIKGLEASLKLDKKKAEQAMEKAIYSNVGNIVQAMVTEAEAGSYQHGSYLLDRAFGKARQNIGIDGGSEGTPIIFMPTELVRKFALDQPIEAEKIEEPNIYDAEGTL